MKRITSLAPTIGIVTPVASNGVEGAPVAAVIIDAANKSGQR